MKKKLFAIILTVIFSISVFALTYVSVSSATYVQDGDWKYEKISNNPSEYYIAGYTGTASAIRIPALFQTKPVTKINNNTFINKLSITYVEIPATVKTIGMNSFYGCSSLETVNIPKSVTEIGANAFYGCASLTNLSFSADTALTVIPRNCFSSCSLLTQVIIPQGVTTISARAFYDCPMLTDVTINPSVTEIGEKAFDGCANMRILGWNDTYAQQYAQENNIPFVSLGDNPYPVVTSEITTSPNTVPTVSTSSPDEIVPTMPTTPDEPGSVPTTSYDVVPSTPTNTTVITTVTETTTTPGQVYLIGDSDLSGNITVKDATIIQKYAAGLSRLDRTQLFLANCDGSGGVNVKDATQIQKHCAGFKNILFVGTEVVF